MKYLSSTTACILLIIAINCTLSYAQKVEGFILKIGDGEPLMNGIVVKVAPKPGKEGPILVEQSFPKGGTTNLHIHDQGDELFYIVSGNGMATLGDQTEEIGVGDVIFVPKGAVHRVENLNHVS